jgi:hypothetical protein
VADGNGGSTEVLLQSNSASCGYVPPTNPPAGTILQEFCTGSDRFHIVADGNGGATTILFQSNSPECCPAAGTVINSSACIGNDKYQVIANGNCTTRNVLVQTNSPSCCPIQGTVVGQNCVGADLYNLIADGTCGSIQVLLTANSPTCSASYPPAGTVLNDHCVGVDRYHTVADGNGGSAEVLVQANSPSCCPAAGTTIGNFTCIGAAKYQPVADGNCGVTNQLIDPKSPECGYTSSSRYEWDTPGTYTIPGTPGVSTASILLKAGDGGGGGGGKAGGGDDTDIGRGRGGAAGGGGGGGGAGQLVTQTITFPENTPLTVVVGAGGAGGAGGSQSYWDGTWRTGQSGAQGGDGTVSAIYDVNGNLLAQAMFGFGGAGGIGATQDDQYAASGGTSGSGYPAGIAGTYNTNQLGTASIELNPLVLPWDYDQQGIQLDPQYPIVPYLGATPSMININPGVGGSGAGVGGNGGTRQDGLGNPGTSGGNGHVIVVTDTSALLGAPGPGYSNGVGSVHPGSSTITYYQVSHEPFSCFPAGSQVLMADKTTKAIENVQVGDMVMGPLGPVEVTGMDTPILGPRAMKTFADGSLLWSEEHSMWTKVGDKQWLWSAAVDSWMSEVNADHIGGLLDNSTIRTGTEGVSWAHLDGWKVSEVLNADGYGPYTKLYLPRTAGSLIIVNGYLVGAGVNERGFDYTKIDWDVNRLDIMK